jgi:hypothetical protein
MRNNILLSMILLLSLVFPLPAKAQFSLKPSPLPTCKTFLLTEIGYHYRINSFPEGLYFYNHRSYFTSDVGIMINLSSKYAIGMVNFFGMDNDWQIRWGVKARVRRWFGPEISADLSLGPNFADSRNHYDKPEFSGELSLNLRDLLIFNILVEVASYRIYQTADYYPWELLAIKKGSDVAIYTGIKLGSEPGRIANIAAYLAGAVYLVLYSFSGD